MGGIRHEPQVEQPREDAQARVEEQRAGQAQEVSDQAADGASRDEPDVEGPVENAERAGHPMLRNDLQQVAVERREQHGRSRATQASKHHGEGEIGSQPGQHRGDAHEHEAERGRSPFAVAIDDWAGEQVEDQPGERECGDEQAGVGVSHAKGPRVEGEDRGDDAEPQHDHERDQHDDAHGTVAEDGANRDLGRCRDFLFDPSRHPGDVVSRTHAAG